MIYNEKNELITREDLEQLQIERLQSTLRRVYRNVAFYKQKFDENKIDITNIKSLEDLQKLPFTTREDLRESYPYDMFAVPLRDIVRIHSTTGKTGKPIAIGYTKNDLKNWSLLVARLFSAIGITDNDFVQIAFDYGMVTGGFGIHYGAEYLGASVIPSASSNIKKQILIMKDYKSTVLIGSPGYAMNVARNLKEMGIHPNELNLKIGLFGIEPWGKNTRKQIEDALQIKAYNIYGVNTIVGPGVAGECEAQDGLHINEDHFIVEVIDPETLEVLPAGSKGELVFTTITREGFPLIRYRTGDISSLTDGVCSCGRGTKRIDAVRSRSDDMIVVSGRNIFPEQIESILKGTGLESPEYNVILENQDGIDLMEISVVVSEDLFADKVKNIVDMKNNIVKNFEEGIGIKVKVTLVEKTGLLDSSKNAIIDKR